MAKIETTLTEAQARIAEAIFGGNYAVTVGKRSGNGVSRAIPLADMPANAVLAIVNYGVQRKFNDAIGGSDTTQEEKLATVDKMIEAYLAGDVGRARAEGVTPMQAEIRIILRKLVKDQMGAEAYKTASNADDFNETLDAIFAEQSDEDRAAIEAAAREALEAKAKAKQATSGLKLGGLAKLTK